MSYEIDFLLATSEQIEIALCKRLEEIRLSKNITHQQLSNESGISLRTLGRLAKGEGITLDTFIRVLIALGIQQNLEILLPDPKIRPMERIELKGNVRKRARSNKPQKVDKKWLWGDENNASE